MHLHGFGEPLLDTSLPEKIRYAKEAGARSTYIVSTGDGLSHEMARALVEAGLDRVKFSCYGFDDDEYERIHRGLSRGSTKGEIQSLVRIRGELEAGGPAIEIQLSDELMSCGSLRNAIAEWSERLEVKYGDKVVLTGLHSWAGRLLIGRKCGRADARCVLPWQQMQVLWDGRVVPCVFDFNGELVLGSAFDEDLWAIWNGRRYRWLRMKQAKGGEDWPAPCRTCETPSCWRHPQAV